jgi:hypothetical protein
MVVRDTSKDWRDDDNLIVLLDQFMMSCRLRRQLDVELRVWLANKIREQWSLPLEKEAAQSPAMIPMAPASFQAPQPAGDDLLLTKEVAPMLRVSAKTLANWRSINRGPRWIKHAGGVRYRRKDVEEFMAWGSS